MGRDSKRTGPTSGYATNHGYASTYRYAGTYRCYCKWPERHFDNAKHINEFDGHPGKMTFTEMSQMKSRPAGLFYVASILSFGIFYFIWLILMMRDINAIEGRTIFRVKRAIWFLILCGGLFVISFFTLRITFGTVSSLRTALVVWTFALAMALGGFLFVALARISLYVTSALEHRSPGAQTALMVVLVFFAQISFVIVQMQINTLMERQEVIASR